MVFETDAENPDNNVWNVHGINLVSKKIGGEMFYCMYNGHADITAMISENGETAEKYYYDEWGKETETSKYGDITGDGKVTVSDYSLLKKHLYIEPLELTSDQKKAADLNADGKVDTSDLNTLKQILFGEKKYCEADTNRDGFINEKNSIKYAGYYYDAETGLYYLNARFYDPETARFIQQDSYSGNIYDPLSLNLYTYSNNNPISYYDPTGHFVNSLIKTFKNITKSVVDTTKEAVTYFTDKTTEVATALVNKTKEIARDTAQKTQEFISHPVQTTSRAAKEFSENWHSGIDQLKQSGTAGQIFGSYSEGVVNNLTNTASGFVQFIKDPLGTVNETVDYFLQDPLVNNPVTALGMYYYDVGKASYAHDWNTVANKVGSGTVTVAEVLGTEYVLKGINGLKKNPAAKNPAGKSSVANGVKGSTTASASGIRNQSRYSLTGAEHYEDLKHVFGADNVKWETEYDRAVFQNYEKLASHYAKHGDEVNAQSTVDYLNKARYVMNNGYKVEYEYKTEMRTGFLRYYKNNKNHDAKFAFVGTNNEGFITTFHTESGKSFWKMLNKSGMKVINPKK